MEKVLSLQHFCSIDCSEEFGSKNCRIHGQHGGICGDLETGAPHHKSLQGPAADKTGTNMFLSHGYTTYGFQTGLTRSQI